MRVVDAVLEAWDRLTPYVEEFKKKDSGARARQGTPEICRGHFLLIWIWVFRREYVEHPIYVWGSLASVTSFVLFEIVTAIYNAIP
ncbi:MAG TPA: hypothetical protein VFA48_06670 [Gammaproteobacteria bacterium]|nr:hypothetical protein [Gammaproteobacteria bacterium]